MTGKMYNGVVGFSTADPRISRAYCEGMGYRASGTLIGKPKVDNPHASSSEDAQAWDAGWDVAEANSAGTISAAAMAPCAVNPGVSA